MAQFKLTYFDFDGGRAEPARLALKLGGLRFEDIRIPIPDWDQHRDQFRYRQLPEFEVDGKKYKVEEDELDAIKKLAQVDEADLKEYKKVEIQLHPENQDQVMQKIKKHIDMQNKGMGVNIKVTPGDDSVTLDGGDYDINREVGDILNFIGAKSAKVVD